MNFFQQRQLRVNIEFEDGGLGQNVCLGGVRGLQGLRGHRGHLQPPLLLPLLQLSHQEPVLVKPELPGPIDAEKKLE